MPAFLCVFSLGRLNTTSASIAVPEIRYSWRPPRWWSTLAELSSPDLRAPLVNPGSAGRWPASRHRHWYIEVWGKNDSWTIGTDNGRHDYKFAQEAVGLNDNDEDIVGPGLHKDGNCEVEDL